VRLFVALWPPQEVVEELRAAVAAVRDLAPGVRWTTPEQWHLTLAFLGEVDEAHGADLEVRLARAAARHAPATLRLAGAGRFGDRVLFVKVTGDVVPVRHLAASVTAAARRARIDVDERPYRPHLTLARAAARRQHADGGGQDEALRLAPVAAALDAFAGSPWSAGELCLVRSHLGRAPGRRAAYETLTAWALGRG